MRLRNDTQALADLGSTENGRALLRMAMADAEAVIPLKARRARFEAAAVKALMDRDQERVDRYMKAADALTEMIGEFMVDEGDERPYLEGDGARWWGE